MLHTFSYVANVLARQHDAAILCFDFDDAAQSPFGLPNVRARFLYSSFGAKRALTWRMASRALREAAREWARQIMSRIATKEDVLRITLDRLAVGSLIYDSYLRRRGRPTVELNDRALNDLVEDAVLIYMLTKEFFDEYDVKAVLPGDVSYIYSGIVARLAVLLNIPVYTIVEGDGLLLTRMDHHFFRRRPYWDYRATFATLPPEQQTAARLSARAALVNRLGGYNVDDIPYMRTSSYGSARRGTVFGDRSAVNIVVFLHCFFDSPHVYRRFLFADFWEWIVFTLQRAACTPFHWYVKPHPNGLPGNTRVIRRLRRMFPNAQFLSLSVSNADLVREGVRAIFTGYGSVGHEMAYLGIPVVAAGDNPRVAYDFVVTPRSVEEYERCIRSADSLVELTRFRGHPMVGA